MATSHAKVCEKGFALCLHKSGSFFAYFYRARARDREYGGAIVSVAWRGKKTWSEGESPGPRVWRSHSLGRMARKENLVRGREPGPRVWRSHSRGGMARKENLVKGREPGTESMAEP